MIFFLSQGEFAVKLEISDVQKIDRGMYKLVAKNEKGEATSQTVEVTELPPEEKPKGEKPKLTKLTNIVSFQDLFLFYLFNECFFRSQKKVNQ